MIWEKRGLRNYASNFQTAWLWGPSYIHVRDCVHVNMQGCGGVDSSGKHLVITWYTVSVVGQRDPAQCSGSSWSQEGRSGDDSLLSCPTEARVSERLMSGSRSLLVEVGACAGSSSPVPHQDLIPGSFQPSKITRSARFSSFKWCSFLQYKAKHLWTSIL